MVCLRSSCPKAKWRHTNVCWSDKLNQAVKRELYQMPTVESTLGSTEEGMYSKLDASSAFHQVPLDSNSRKLTTFITPFGRFMFKRLPYGISSTPEYYQKRMMQVLKGLLVVKWLVDDILMIGRNQIELDERLRAVLDRLQVYSLFPGLSTQERLLMGKEFETILPKFRPLSTSRSHVMSQNCEASLAW